MTYPQQPAYQPPPPPGAYQQGYPQQPAYGQPPQAPYQPQAPAYGQPQPPAPPQPPPVRATLDELADQATGGATAHSKYFTDTRKQDYWIQFQIPRNLLAGDVRQQTDNNNVGRFVMVNGAPDYARPKLELLLPAVVFASCDNAHPAIFTEEGAATVYLKGAALESFKQAIAAAGLDPDKVLRTGQTAGATVTMISAGEKAPYRPGNNPTKLYKFQYVPGAPQAAPVAPVAPAVAAAPSPAVPPAPPAAPQGPPPPPQGTPGAYQQGYAPAPPQGYAPPPQAPPAPPPPPPQAPPQGYAPPPPPPAYAPPADPEKAALLAELNGTA